MKNCKKIIATLTMVGIIMMGVTATNAGILMSDFTGADNNPAPCSLDNSKGDFIGIIVGGFTGIIVGGFTGVSVEPVNNDEICVRVDSGILMSD